MPKAAAYADIRFALDDPPPRPVRRSISLADAFWRVVVIAMLVGFWGLGVVMLGGLR